MIQAGQQAAVVIGEESCGSSGQQPGGWAKTWQGLTHSRVTERLVLLDRHPSVWFHLADDRAHLPQRGHPDQTVHRSHC